MTHDNLLPHLFRTEFRKITSVLGKLFGIDHIEIAEDIASETFLAAMETWTFKGIPENPTAWLYAVAKNKAKNYAGRNHLFKEKISSQLKISLPATYEIEIDLSEKNITDSQLQMLFALCHPSISAEAQIGLSLRILCGFGIDEIATAFLTNRETINKRLFRAREKLRTEKIKIEFPNEEEINNRLDTVLTTLYLLFNEGYYSESQNSLLREDLCQEAMRLTGLLIDSKETSKPRVKALLALMCFHASRFEARKMENGEVILYNDQDEGRWDQELIAKGAVLLHESTNGNELSKYHLEASIAWWQTNKADSSEKWASILQLYNQLLMIEYSPVAALNRTYALSKVKGNAAAITEAEKLDLVDSHFYFMLLGELYKEIDVAKARVNFEKALQLAKTNTEKQLIGNKLASLS